MIKNNIAKTKKVGFLQTKEFRLSVCSIIISFFSRKSSTLAPLVENHNVSNELIPLKLS
jgi:hypothetical protein